ncbi:MAG: hypothetical protein LPK18_10025 [Pseudomonadaceae bacterium]|nr:hypothetical protein [Pseudomonadaceae bacterium]
MPRPLSLALRLVPLLLPIGLTLLALSPASHSPAGVLQLFLFSLFVSLGFLLFGSRHLDEPARETRRSA